LVAELHDAKVALPQGLDAQAVPRVALVQGLCVGGGEGLGVGGEGGGGLGAGMGGGRGLTCSAVAGMGVCCGRGLFGEGGGMLP
jgi:hypothetical protein